MSITPVQVAHFPVNGAASVSGSLSNVANGNTVVAILAVQHGAGGTYTLNSISDTAGALTAIQAFELAQIQSGIYAGIGVYVLPSSATGTHTVAAAFSVNVTGDLFLVEVPLGGSPTADVSSPALRNTAQVSVVTNSITTESAGDFVIAVFIAETTGLTYSAWTNSFTLGDSDNSTSSSTAWGYLPQPSAGAITAGATLSSAIPSIAGIVALTAAAPAPTVTSVNGGTTLTEGSTSIPVVGTSFASGLTSAIVQGSVTLAQTITYDSATAATFDLTMEPGTGTQLSFGDATFEVTVGGQTGSLDITLAPPDGNLYVTLTSINTDSTSDITASPALAIGDQIEASGNITGTSAAPAGLVINADSTFDFTTGNTPTNFYARAWDSSTQTWGSWALQTVTSGGVTITIPSGLIPYLHQLLSLLPG